MGEEDLARAHAAASYADPSNFQERGPRTEAYVGAALAELERLQAAGPGLVAALLDGGSQIAKQLNADAFQGFREIVQNADDLGATSVRFGVRTRDGQRQLLVVHDGHPVELMHVLPMVYPAISTRRNQASAKGRFGVGLKTLTRLGANLTIHSAPYHFASRNNLAVRTAPAPTIPGFYSAETDTLLTLDLNDEVEDDFVDVVFSAWATDDLVFLDAVRSVSVIDLDAGAQVFRFEVDTHPGVETFDLAIGGSAGQVEARRLQLGDREWLRFSIALPVPVGLARTNKATGDVTRLSLALPVHGLECGWVHVALPTRISTGAPFSLDAQFNPATSREDLSSDKWNRWLVNVAAEFCGALAIHLAQTQSPLAWSVVPVGAQTNSTSTWLNAHFAAGWTKAVEAFSNEPSLIGPDPARSLAMVAYSDAQIEDLLDGNDYLEVGGAQELPVALRDAGGRWRSVLETIGLSRKISLLELMQACERPLEHRPPSWFLSLAHRCLEAGKPDLLFEGRWLPLVSGGRVGPQYEFGANELLVAEPPETDFAIRLGLCRQVHPILTDEDHAEVRSALEEEGNLLQKADACRVIGAFASRYADQPLAISRDDLAALRDLFGELTDREAEELGQTVGDAILLEATRYEASDKGGVRQVPVEARPSEVYLPSSIEDETDGWSRAAGQTHGLLWAANAYADVFKVAARKELGSAGTRRMRGAKRFLLLLGANVGPRLEEVDTPLTVGMPPAQWAARRGIRSGQGVLRNDLVSPDLDLVLADIMAAGASPARRRGRASKSVSTVERTVALFRSLSSRWSAYDDRRTTWARRNSGYGGNLAQAPATWIVRLASLAWMRNELGEPCAPEGLAIATRITTAMETDPRKFAAGLTSQDAVSPLSKALGMKVDPTASELIAALERHRDGQSESDVASVLRIYHALSGHCPQAPGTPSPDAKAGNVTVGALRAKFGIKRSARGLILGHVTTAKSDEWFAPTAVFQGKDIFHGRQPFVLSDKTLQPLWNALNISAPGISACIRELHDIAKSEPIPERDAVLIDIYRHLDHLLERSAPAERRELVTVPLVSDGAWVTGRPIYLGDHYGIAVKGLSLWTAPCAPHTISKFVEAAGVSPLQVDDRPVSEIFGTPEDLQVRFQSALRIFQADLARDDERSYRALEPWSRISGLALIVHGEDSLAIEVRDVLGRATAVLVRDHTDVPGAAIHVDREEVIGRVEYGGHAIARLAPPDRRREIALAWGAAWATSADADQSYVIELAGDAIDQNVDELAKRHEGLKAKPRRRISAGGPEAPDAAATVPKIEVRVLKPLPEEFVFSAELQGGDGETPKGMQVRRNVALRSGGRDPTASSPPTGKQPAPATAHRRYDQTQLQQKGWAYVVGALEDGAIAVTDLQKERGVGADGAINWKTFVEMKSVGREMPATITLTATEFRRAREAKGDFLLVVVCGLEEGFETQLYVYADPLNTLPWTTTGSVSVGGLAAGRRLIIRHDGQGEEGSAGVLQ